MSSHNYLESRRKRIFDIVFSIFGLVVTAVVAPFTAVVVYLGSPGPILYWQTRYGKNGVEFEIVKFRTMRVNAEPNGAQWAVQDDPRVFWSGRYLRRLYVDELPQWWNVLRGEMSVVGPRPERPELADNIGRSVSNFETRLMAKPGITGLAQIHHRYGANMSDARNKLRLDSIYIDNASIVLDFKIILSTLRRILFSRGT